MKKYKETIFISLLIILVIANVFFTVSVSASGIELASIEKTQNDLILKNQEIMDKITAESSLSKIEEQAGILGFTKPETIVYATSVEPVAKLP